MQRHRECARVCIDLSLAVKSTSSLFNTQPHYPLPSRPFPFSKVDQLWLTHSLHSSIQSKKCEWLQILPPQKKVWREDVQVTPTSTVTRKVQSYSLQVGVSFTVFKGELYASWLTFLCSSLLMLAGLRVWMDRHRWEELNPQSHCSLTLNLEHSERRLHLARDKQMQAGGKQHHKKRRAGELCTLPTFFLYSWYFIFLPHHPKTHTLPCPPYTSAVHAWENAFSMH